jgi:circadian clock protein KaiB
MNSVGAVESYILCLYIAGMTPTAKRALDNITVICREHLCDNYSIEVVDLFEQPALAECDQIFAVPTLVRQIPLPLKKLIGDLADAEKVLAGLGIEARKAG